jgi:uncharacterized protein involved in outer membrane biogenesis
VGCERPRLHQQHAEKQFTNLLDETSTRPAGNITRRLSCTAMTLKRLLQWITGMGLALLVSIVLFVVFVDWNWWREPISRRVSSATGRSFVINGDLRLDLSLPPRMVASDLVFGNAAWSSEPTMARIKRLELTIDLFKLLAGRVEFPEIALSEPHLTLEVRPDGVPNWVFNEQDKNHPVDFPTIGVLTIDHGSVTYRDPQVDTALAFEVRTLADGKHSPEFRLEVDGKGRFKGLPTTLHAQGGALLGLRSAHHPYPISAKAILGTTRASIDGSLLDPLHLKGEEVNFTLEGSDLALLFPIIGVPFPPSPAYKLVGFLDRSGDVWTFRRFKGTVGQSDLAGDFTVDRGPRPQMISADLVSKQLVMKDLGGFIGARRGTQASKIRPPSNRVLPAEPFSLEKLQAANADVRFRGEKILTANLPLSRMSAHLLVNDGVLKLAPLDFGIAGGQLVSLIEMDGRQPRIAIHADITAKGLRLDQLFPHSRLAAPNTGTMGGRARLAGHGSSLAQMLASADGETALIMDGGSVGELLLRLSNLDIANSLLTMLGGDKQVPIRCMVGNFKAVKGNFTVQELVLDTLKVNITGSGHVNFTDESLNLRLVPQSKGFSLASLRGPIVITGTFKTPAVRPEMGGVIARGALAVALGAVTSGVGLLIPLLDFGEDKDSNCAALLAQARSDTGVKSSDLAPRSRNRGAPVRPRQPVP